jgi:parallel beta-helix repeat protein
MIKRNSGAVGSQPGERILVVVITTKEERTMIRKFIAITATLLLVAGYAGATDINGSITTQTWTAASSPYRVTGAITVLAGKTLTIEPGVDVLFDADVQFIVEGSLHAVGTETDSIRFVKGTAPEWMGLRLTNGDTSTIHYARISDGNADGPSYDDQRGGGITVGEYNVAASTGTRLGLAHAVIENNVASMNGGGIELTLSAHATLSDCRISSNTSNGGGPGGGGLDVHYSAAAELTRCLIVDNAAVRDGAGVGAHTATLTLDRCTIVGNTSATGYGGIYAVSSTFTASNTIEWGNTPQTPYGVTTATYSDIQGGFTGTGNINVDPLFVSVANGDYSLQASSPCVDTGDPASPHDPDGTRADMGAIYLDQGPTEIRITADSLWSKSNSPYRIDLPVIVEPGNTLTIEPGVEVLFDADVQFIVQGALHAVGTETDSIRFVANVAAGNAEWGGLRISGGDSSTIAYSRISDGNADGAGFPNYNGGGIYVSDADTRLVLYNSVITGNTANEDGGGIYVRYNSTATLTNCTISSNTGYLGGGVANAWLGTTSLTNCVLIGNTAWNGGGLNSQADATATLINCTFSGNSANVGGGLFHASSVTATLTNCIMWSDSPQEVYVSSGTVTATYSNIGGGYTGVGNIDSDPLFVNAAADDFHLQTGSPCIGTGESGADMGAFATEQGGTGISGTITTTTWTAANSPYHIGGTITVPTGNTLTIEPGVDVLFDADVQFIVQGALNAVGTEADSIRFIKGTAVEWMGFRFSGGDSSTFHFARISDGHADGVTDADKTGGAMRVDGVGTRVGMSDCIVSGNIATHYGGGIHIYYGYATLNRCVIANNSAGFVGGGLTNDRGYLYAYDSRITGNYAAADGGGLYNAYTYQTTMVRCLLDHNKTTNRGGAIVNFYSPNNSDYINCTFVANEAANGSAIANDVLSPTAVITNCILWDDGGAELYVNGGTITANYSNIKGSYTGTGNINTDPLFADTTNGNYSLQIGSPSIDTGDPASPLDPDGSRADMGAFFYNHAEYVNLPTISSPRGATVDIDITGTIDGRYSTDLAFHVDTTIIDTYALASSVFDYNDVNLVYDTLYVGLASSVRESVTDGVIATLQLTIKPDAALGAYPLTWLPHPDTHVDDGLITTTDGQLSIVNQAPTWVNPPADITTNENAGISFTFEATDADVVDALVYAVIDTPLGTAFDAGTRTLSWTPDYDAVTTAEGSKLYEFIFNVTDAVDLITDTVKITVNNIDRIPYWDPQIADQTITETQSVNFQINASDLDGDAITYDSVSKPAGAVWDVETHSYSWTTDYADAGVYTFNYTATAAGYEVPGSNVVTVLDSAIAPVWDVTPAQSVDEEQLLQFTVSATDEDDEPLPFVYRTPVDLPVGAAFDTASAIFTWTPDSTFVSPAQGTLDVDVTFKVYDGAFTVDQVVTITVTHVNQSPHWSAPSPIDLTQNVAEAQGLTFSVLAEDPDGDAITYTATDLPGDATFDGSRGTFNWSTTTADSGTYVVTFHASDGEFTIDDPVTIVVGDVPLPPEWDPAMPDSSVDESELLTLVFNATDPDNEPLPALTYAAVQIPPDAVLTGSTLTWTPGYDQVTPVQGTLVTEIIVSATDGEFTIKDTVYVTVTHVNQAPVWEPVTPLTGGEETTFVIPLDGTDADGEILGYELIDGPFVGSSNLEVNQWTWTPGYDAVASGDPPQDYTVSIDVADGVDTVSRTVTMTVSNVNRAPSFTLALPDTSAEPDDLFTKGVAATDPDGDAVTLSLVEGPNWGAFASPTFNGSPDYFDYGDTIVVISASDGVATTLDTMGIHVYDRFGDASWNSEVSAMDAALILAQSVRKTDTLTVSRADVSGNLQISAFDAALVLIKVVNPGFIFPVLGGVLPKPAASISWTVTMERTASGWACVVNNPSGLYSGDLQIELPSDRTVRVSGANVASKQNGHVLTVAFARGESGTRSLFNIESGLPHEAPTTLSALLNDGDATVGRSAPARFALHQNMPNPFNPKTSIHFDLPFSSSVNLSVYNASGQLVRDLIVGEMAAGGHEVTWDARDDGGRMVASGVYLYRMNWQAEGASGVVVKRMLLLR